MISQVGEKISQVANLNKTPKKVLEKEDFIKLFITQLQYQDPMNPIENHEMAMQLALFNQVDQLFNLNNGLNEIKNMIQNFSLNIAGSLIGKKVKIETNVGRVEGGNFLGGDFSLEEPANKVQIVIKNEDGKTIRTIEMNGVSKGTHKIEWDATDQNGNKVPDGNYYLFIQILGSSTKEVTPVMIGKITGAQIGDEVKLVVNEKIIIGFKEIKEILGG